jgi:glyoxylase-like metal-dependent hydrolase (beta-lactamase superfamily II)
MRRHRIKDVTAIRDAVEVPVLGALPINAFVLHSSQPVLVDTGRPVAKSEFLDQLGSAIDLADIRWIWLTHPDRDHMGSLFDVLAAAPQARLVTTFLAVGYLTVEFDVPFDRVYLLNPGQALDVGDRKLHAFRPPLFDSPMTVGFYDDKTGTCFSSDCFGAPMPNVDAALVDDIRDISAEELRAAQLVWAGADSPWVRNIDVDKFRATYDGFRRWAPQTVFSTHLPPVTGQTPTLIDMLDHAPQAPELDAPDQAMLEAMLAGIPAQADAPPPMVDVTEEHQPAR